MEPFRASGVLRVGPVASSCHESAHADPSPWNALHSHPPGEIKPYQFANILSSVKCSTLPRPNIALPFPFVPEPVPGLSGPGSSTVLLLLCKVGVTSRGCNSQVPEANSLPRDSASKKHWQEPGRWEKGESGCLFPFFLHLLQHSCL